MNYLQHNTVYKLGWILFFVTKYLVCWPDILPLLMVCTLYKHNVQILYMCNFKYIYWIYITIFFFSIWPHPEFRITDLCWKNLDSPFTICFTGYGHESCNYGGGGLGIFNFLLFLVYLLGILATLLSSVMTNIMINGQSVSIFQVSCWFLQLIFCYNKKYRETGKGT